MAVTDERIRRARRDAQRNHERVLAAAGALFAERGTDVTMEEIAARAGVGVGTIYRRFPSKDHLLAAIRQDACSQMQHCLAEAAQTERDPIRQLRALILVQYRRVAAPVALIDLRPPQEEDAAAAHVQADLYRSLHHMLEQVIRNGQHQGVIRTGNPAILAALCLELLNPRTLENLQHVVGANPETIADYAVEFVLGGLSAH